MTTNESTDTAQTVRTARTSRRARYASMRADVSGSGLVEERRRVRGARRARVLRVGLPRRDISQPVAHDAHAHGGRGLPHRADAVLLVHENLPDVLGDLVALRGLLAARRAEELQRLDQLGILGRLALLPAAGVPAGDRMPEERLHRIYRQGMAREEIEHLGAVVGPERDLVLVACDAREEEAPLQLLDVGLDADLLPLLLDHLGDLRVGDEGARRGLQLEAEPPLAVGAQPIALAVLLGEAGLVEELIGLLDVEGGPLLAPLRPR